MNFWPAVGKNENFKIKLLLRNKQDNNAGNYQTLLNYATGGDDSKVGIIAKERAYNKENGNIIGPFETLLDEEDSLELVDVAPALSLVMGPKDETEWDLMKKSSVLSNLSLIHISEPTRPY